MQVALWKKTHNLTAIYLKKSCRCIVYTLIVDSSSACQKEGASNILQEETQQSTWARSKLHKGNADDLNVKIQMINSNDLLMLKKRKAEKKWLKSSWFICW